MKFDNNNTSDVLKSQELRFRIHDGAVGSRGVWALVFFGDFGFFEGDGVQIMITLAGEQQPVSAVKQQKSCHICGPGT